MISKRSAIIDYPKKMYQEIYFRALEVKKYFEVLENKENLSNTLNKLRKELKGFGKNAESENEYSHQINNFMSDILGESPILVKLLKGEFNGVEVNDEYEPFQETFGHGDLIISENTEHKIKGYFTLLFPVLFIGPRRGSLIGDTPETSDITIDFIYDKNTKEIDINTIDPAWINKAESKIYNLVDDILNNELSAYITETGEYDRPYYQADLPEMEMYPKLYYVTLKVGENSINGLLDFSKPLREYQKLVNSALDLSKTLYKIKSLLDTYVDINKNSATPVHSQDVKKSNLGPMVSFEIPMDISDTEQYAKHTWIREFNRPLRVKVFQKGRSGAAGSYDRVDDSISIFGLTRLNEDSLKSVIKHELVHMMQEVITNRVIRDKPRIRYKEMGTPGNFDPKEYMKYNKVTNEEEFKQHTLSDVEFFPRVVDLAENMRRSVLNHYIDYDERPNPEINRISDLPPNEKRQLLTNRFENFLQNNKILKYLREGNQDKYKKMLRELYRQFDQISKSANLNISKRARVVNFSPKDLKRIYELEYKIFQLSNKDLAMPSSIKKLDKMKEEMSKLLSRAIPAMASIFAWWIKTHNLDEIGFTKEDFVDFPGSERELEKAYDKFLIGDYSRFEEYFLRKQMEAKKKKFSTPPFSGVIETGKQLRQGPSGNVGEDMVLFQKALNTAHYGGLMVNHLAERLGITKQDLDNLSDGKYVEEWDNEIKQFSWNKTESIHKTAIDNILEKKSKDTLKEYNKKRNFQKTPEPHGEGVKKNKYRFVIQKHDANIAKTHFDLRLENDEGSMTSWAIPKAHLPNGKEKLLAMQTEPHPVSYIQFGKNKKETIESGYGAGTVKVYDHGTYKEIEKSKDTIKFKLNGNKETGTYTLHRTGGKKWLLMVASNS